MEDYLLDKALAEAVLTYTDGTALQGEALAAEAIFLREAWLNLRRLSARCRLRCWNRPLSPER